MQDAINKFKNRLFIFSFGLGLASTIWVFQPNESLKNIGKSLFSFSIAGIVLGEVFITKVTSEINKKDEVTEEKMIFPHELRSAVVGRFGLGLTH